MATVYAEDDLTKEEHSQHRGHRALRVAIVAGFMGKHQKMQETCLDLCNAFREGIPLGCLRIAQNAPPTLLTKLLPNTSQVQPTGTVLTRILQHRRVLKVHWIYSAMFEDKVGEMQWPEGIKEMDLSRFNRVVNDVVWPVGLNRLSFSALGPLGDNIWSLFNHSLQGIIFPSGLREIFLGSAFNQSIEDVLWPQGLERMSLPGYDHPIDDVKWPLALKSLEFMCPEQIKLRQDPNTWCDELSVDEDGFNTPFTKLPASLETLWLSDNFAQRSLECIVWPAGLVTVGFGGNFCPQFFTMISWPSSLRNIYSFDEIDAPPEGCVVTVVQEEYDSEYTRELEEDSDRDPDLY